MLVRVNDGIYAGEVREFPSHIARDLILRGRAVNPFSQIEDPREPAAPVTVAAIMSAKPARNGRVQRSR